MEMNSYLKIVKKFNIEGICVECKPLGTGHINETLVVKSEQSGRVFRYVLRKINKYVFKNPELIIHNTLLVTRHLKNAMQKSGERNVDRKTLRLIETNEGEYSYIDDNGDYWCMMNFIENAYTVDKVDTKTQAYEAAKAFGKFQKYLADIDLSKCYTTIEDFHNLSKRLQNFDKAIEKDTADRVKDISKEIDSVNKFRYINASYFEKIKSLPERITHNDTKINNVMLDKYTSEGLCVIDLDTVMPGKVLNDFGDMVRTFTSGAPEDEKDLSCVFVRTDIFEAMCNGYLTEVKNILTGEEIETLIFGAPIIIFEQAVRFLTDYIEGDIYYKVKYEEHNLIRARNQLALLKSVEKNFETMRRFVLEFR